jgi:CRP-like cAMP-binding protein
MMDVEKLRDIELFAGLSEEDLAKCASAFEHQQVLAGTPLTREGDFSYRFFVVLDGQVEVLQDFESVATLGPGECFGEMGVASDEPRNARVVATERSEVASMIAWDFRQTCEQVPVLGERIQQVIDQRS